MIQLEGLSKVYAMVANYIAEIKQSPVIKMEKSWYTS
jgi:hypothetical protein